MATTAPRRSPRLAAKAAAAAAAAPAAGGAGAAAPKELIDAKAAKAYAAMEAKYETARQAYLAKKAARVAALTAEERAAEEAVKAALIEEAYSIIAAIRAVMKTGIAQNDAQLAELIPRIDVMWRKATNRPDSGAEVLFLSDAKWHITRRIDPAQRCNSHDERKWAIEAMDAFISGMMQ